MELSEIVSIAGMPGLHKIVAHRPNGFILETLDETKKRFPTNAATRVSVLEEIAMFTTTEEVPLRKVLKLVFEKEKEGLQVPDKKAENNELADFMAKVLPDYDKERVYPSDIKKLANWYTTLKNSINLEELKESLEEETVEEAGTDEGEEKPKKTRSVKADADKKINTAKKVAAKASSRSAGASKTNMPRKTGGGG